MDSHETECQSFNIISHVGAIQSESAYNVLPFSILVQKRIVLLVPYAEKRCLLCVFGRVLAQHVSLCAHFAVKEKAHVSVKEAECEGAKCKLPQSRGSRCAR